jgi:hypothetical protein
MISMFILALVPHMPLSARLKAHSFARKNRYSRPPKSLVTDKANFLIGLARTR